VLNSLKGDFAEKGFPYSPNSLSNDLPLNLFPYLPNSLQSASDLKQLVS